MVCKLLKILIKHACSPICLIFKRTYIYRRDALYINHVQPSSRISTFGSIHVCSPWLSVLRKRYRWRFHLFSFSFILIAVGTMHGQGTWVLCNAKHGFQPKPISQTSCFHIWYFPSSTYYVLEKLCKIPSPFSLVFSFYQISGLKLILQYSFIRWNKYKDLMESKT